MEDEEPSDVYCLSPRECVFVMGELASDDVRVLADSEEALAYLRFLLKEQECRPDPLSAPWDWRASSTT